MQNIMMKKVVIGDLIDFYEPNLDFIQNNRIYEWWNNPNVTKYLSSGTTENTLEKQMKYYSKTTDCVFFYSDKNEIIGTIMLQNIDCHRKTATLGIVRGIEGKNKKPLQSLEAVARITEIGFNSLGLERIIAQHHIGHIPFSHRLSLLGYRLEGILKNDFIKNDWSEVNDIIHTVCHKKDYQKIVASRGGSLWDSQDKMLQRVKHLPHTPFHVHLKDFFNKSQEYYDNIFFT